MQPSTLEGKTVFITGAAQRIGAEVARTLHQAGANVIIHYRSSQVAAESLQASLNQQREQSCFLVQGDLLALDSLHQLAEQVIAFTGRLDILINNASSFYETPIGEITTQHWDDLMGTNVKIPLFLTQALSQELVKQKGVVINMIDVHGMRPRQGFVVYSTAKAALAMLTQSLARELAPYVRVNGVAPGAILWPEQSDEGLSQQAIIEKTALKREGSPEDIAKTILFLVRDAQYVTGHILPVDGGRLLNH